MTMHTLYLCYFGLREPLVQTQVLPYLRELAAGGIQVSLLTFEPELSVRWGEEQISTMRACLQEEGISWRLLPYHKRPSLPATLWDIAAGARMAAQLMRSEGATVLHARGQMPLAMALLAQRLARSGRVIFDVRGLMADEYADAGVWLAGSPAFRAVKWLERLGIEKADQVVVLTDRMRTWLIERGWASAEKIEVIPCCTKMSRFTAPVEPSRAPEALQRVEAVYAGSVTGLYLLEEIGRFFLAFQAFRPKALLRILTTSPPEAAAERLRQAGLRDDDFWIGAAAPTEVAAYLRRATVGLSFRKATFSQIAASPTKIPEYLAAGLPVVANAGIGDSDELLRGERVGIVIEDFTADAYQQAAAQLNALLGEPELIERCRLVARRYFDLATVGGVRYRRVYARLAAKDEAASAPQAHSGIGLKADG